MADAAAYAAPAGLSESLVESGLTKGVLHPDYPLYWAIITQSALYAFAAVLAGSLSP